ncbi:Prenyltransferase OS=Streptomyces violarus OX=67380 GN=FHS41_002110 PE=4 SV=1 [Streptomyces violarus]
MERICRYLTSVSTADGALPAIHPSQRGYPTAPFVPVVDDPPSALLATGPVVGLLHRNEVWHAWLFRATDFCWQAVESLEESHPYEIEAAVAFLDSAPDRPRAEAAADRLGRLVRAHRLAALDPDGLDAYPVSPGYAPGEHHFPYDYARTPQSLARAWFTDDEMTRSLDHLASQQQEDGGWPVRWRRWAPAPALEARPLVTVEALRTLRSHGRPVG